jgi:hypothetical protein
MFLTGLSQVRQDYCMCILYRCMLRCIYSVHMCIYICIRAYVQECVCPCTHLTQFMTELCPDKPIIS